MDNPQSSIREDQQSQPPKKHRGPRRLEYPKSQLDKIGGYALLLMIFACFCTAVGALLIVGDLFFAPGEGELKTHLWIFFSSLALWIIFGLITYWALRD